MENIKIPVMQIVVCFIICPSVIFVGYSAAKTLKTDQTPKSGFLPT